MSDSKRPNILWVCTDQQRWDTIGALGNRHVATPTVDHLVGAGAAFTSVYCQSPICTPSRASFLTGVYPSTVHVNGNGNEVFPAHGPPLVTKLLADTGYDCGLVGKLHLASAHGRVEPRIDDGYRYWEYSHAPRDDWPTGHGYADWVRAQGQDLDELRQRPEGIPTQLHQTTWCAQKAIEFIGQPRPADTPWLLSVNIYDPHPPFNPPQSYRDRFDVASMPGPLYRDSDLGHQARLEAAGIDFQSRARHTDDLDIGSPVVQGSPKPGGGEAVAAADSARRDARTLQAAYYAMIAQIDDRLADMLQALQDSGQAEDTLVIFTSDHGETLGDHGLIQKGCRFYEGLVRVPLVMVWPGRIEPGLRSDALVELTDLAPTLLELAGEAVPAHMQGRSLAPILCGAAAAGEHRDWVRCEYYDALDEPDGTCATMYRDRRHKLVVYHGKDVGELYDLHRDPGEFDDLWSDPASATLKTDLLQRSFDVSTLAMDRGPRRVGPI